VLEKKKGINIIIKINILTNMELGNMEIYSTATSIVDIMNAFLILICSIFAIVIVGTLRDKKLESIVRSVHFLSIDKIITAWTLIGSSILLLAIVEILYAVKIVTDIKAYKLFRTIFGIFLATGLFVLARLLLRYVKQIRMKKKEKKRKRKPKR